MQQRDRWTARQYTYSTCIDGEYCLGSVTAVLDTWYAHVFGGDTNADLGEFPTSYAAKRAVDACLAGMRARVAA